MLLVLAWSQRDPAQGRRFAVDPDPERQLPGREVAEVDGFDPNQGTELLSFMARVLERCIKRWLGLTS